VAALVHGRPRRWRVLPALLAVLAACNAPSEIPPRAGRAAPGGHADTGATATATPPVTDAPPRTEAPPAASEDPGAATPRPAWLGTRVLPRRPDGYGEVRRTPPVLRDRRLVTVDHLPPPRSPGFQADVGPVPDDVARRATWSEDCPVGLAQLRYVTVTFWGFDERRHTGELLLHRRVARDVVGVFRQLHRARFPIEEMRVVAAPELDAPPTGDGNNTTSFVCRPSRGSTRWSQHAYGLAVDVNPFHNPYIRGDLVLPELASAYGNRDRRRPGMVVAGGVVTRAFAAIGWGWGGDWSSLRDWMHFSADGT
jgi:hypothetical protein